MVLAMHSQPTLLLRLQLPYRLESNTNVSQNSRLLTVEIGMSHNFIGTMDVKEDTCPKFGGSRWIEEP